MARFWASWWSGNYADEGCTKPPFNFWVSGQRERANDDPEGERDECSLCAVIDAEDDLAVQKLIAEHYPDHVMRFCEQKPDNFTPGNRFPQ